MVEVVLVLLAVAVGITVAMRMDVEPRPPVAPRSGSRPGDAHAEEAGAGEAVP